MCKECDALINNYNAAYQQKDYEKALEIAEKLVGSHDIAENRLRRAGAKHKRGITEGMIEDLNRGKEALDKIGQILFCDKHGYYYIRGVAKLQLRIYHEAVNDLEEAVKAYDKNDIPVWLKKNLSLAYEALGEFDKALKYADKIDFDRIKAKLKLRSFELATSYYKAGNYDEALKEFKQFIADNKECNKINSYAHYYAGNCLMQLKHLKEAIQEYEQAIKHNPYSYASYYKQGLCFAELGYSDKAEMCYQKAIKLSDNIPTVSAVEELTRNELSHFSSFETLRTGTFKQNDLEKMYLLVRDKNGIDLRIYNPAEDNWNTAARGPLWSNIAGFNQCCYSQSLRTAVLTVAGKVRIYVTVREPSGFTLHYYDIEQDQWFQAQKNTFNSVASGWNNEAYSLPTQLMAMNQQLLLVTRNSDGLYFSTYDPDKNVWTLQGPATGFSDKNLWDNRECYSSMFLTNLATAPEKAVFLGRFRDGRPYLQFINMDVPTHLTPSHQQLVNTDYFKFKHYGSTKTNILAVNGKDYFFMLDRTEQGITIYKTDALLEVASAIKKDDKKASRYGNIFAANSKLNPAFSDANGFADAKGKHAASIRTAVVKVGNEQKLLVMGQSKDNFLMYSVDPVTLEWQELPASQPFKDKFDFITAKSLSVSVLNLPDGTQELALTALDEENVKVHRYSSEIYFYPQQYNEYDITRSEVKIGATKKLEDNLLSKKPENDTSPKAQGIHPSNEDYKQKILDFKNKLKHWLSQPDHDQPVKMDRIIDEDLGYQYIHLAAWYGDSELLDLLQNNWKDFAWNKKAEKSEDTLLHCAAANNQIEMVKFLLNENRLDINALNSQNETALHLAAKHGYLDLSKFLVEAGAQIQLLNKDNLLAAELAHNNGHNQLAKFLIEIDMVAAVASNDLTRVSLLESKSIIKDIASLKDQQNNSLIFVAAINLSYEVFEHLAINKAFLKLKDKADNTLLHVAASLSDTRFMDFLLPPKNIIDLDSRNKQGQTPLHIALLNNRNLHAKKLLDLRASRSISAKLYKNEKLNALELAVALGRESILQYLYDNSKLSTPAFTSSLLWLAVKFDQEPILRFILGKERFLNFHQEMLTQNPKFNYQTLLSYAASLGRKKMIWLLVEEFKFPIDHIAEDIRGKSWSALHWAIAEMQLESVITLLDLGANPMLATGLENNPSQLANLRLKETTDPAHKSIYEDILNQINHAIKMGQNKNRFNAYKEFLPKNLVFQGGGARGIAHLGALKALEKNNISLSSIQRVGGSSAGAIVAVLLAVGYSPKELENILLEKSLIDFLDFDKNLPKKENITVLQGLKTYAECIYKNKSLNPISCFLSKGQELLANVVGNIYQQAGLCKGEEFLNWIEALIEQKTHTKYLTLGELAELVKKGKGTYKHLSVVGVELGKSQKGWIFSSEDERMKDYIVSDLVRISMSIPGIFAPHQIHIKADNQGQPKRLALSDDSQYYIDGGIFKNYPLDIYDYEQFQGNGDAGYPRYNPYTLGFRLFDQKQADNKELSNFAWLIDVLKKRGIGEDLNLINLVKDLLSAYYHAEAVVNSFDPQEQYALRTVAIDCLGKSMLDFGMSQDEQKALMDSGAKAIENYFKVSNINPNFDTKSDKYENTCIGDYCSNHADSTMGSAWPLPGAAGQLVSFSYLPESNLRVSPAELPVPALIIDQPQNNNYTAIPENLIHFDYGAWDKNPSLHPETSEPIFTYRAYENNNEVGSMSFYKHPLLCRSEAGDRHNLLAMTGIFKQINFDTKTLEEVCASLPPTLFDKAITSAKHGATHGAIRGVANVVGYTLQARQVPKKIANIIQKALYYGGYFILRYNEHASHQKDNEWESMFNSLTQAAKDTGSIFIMGWTVNWLSNKIQQIGLNAEQRGWTKTGRAFQFFGRNSQYAMYAYDINQTGIAAASSIAAGTVTQTVVEKIGIPIANKL